MGVQRTYGERVAWVGIHLEVVVAMRTATEDWFVLHSRVAAVVLGFWSCVAFQPEPCVRIRAVRAGRQNSR